MLYFSSVSYLSVHRTQQVYLYMRLCGSSVTILFMQRKTLNSISSSMNQISERPVKTEGWK